MTFYSIIRFYRNDDHQSQTIYSGLTLEQAQAHCNDPETSSKTATNAPAAVRTAKHGPWFDGYTEDNDTAPRAVFDLSDTGPYATDEDAWTAKEIGTSVVGLRLERAWDDAADQKARTQ